MKPYALFSVLFYGPEGSAEEKYWTLPSQAQSVVWNKMVMFPNVDDLVLSEAKQFTFHSTSLWV